MPSGELVQAFREAGGGDKPARLGMTVCWAATEEKGAATAHRLWRNIGVPGVAQTLPAPRDFEAVGAMVTERWWRAPSPAALIRTASWTWWPST